jgi:uncharacterized membrane protein YeaQ/YmgE (transglycosylase-associated protein family)
MDLIVTGVIAGVLGTLVMDSLNHLFARIGVISKIDVGIIGRMAVGWTQGRFMYRHPDEMECIPNEMARARLGSLGWRACVTGMGICLWSSDNGSLPLFCIPFDGIWHVR